MTRKHAARCDRVRGCFGLAIALLAAPLAGRTAVAAPVFGAPYVSYPIGRGPTDLALADFDDDGAFDIVTADFLGGTITFSGGTFDGQFRPARVVAQVTAPTSILAADFDIDGDPDLIVTSYDPPAIFTLGNDGHGNFEVRQVLESLNGPVDALLLDVNNDLRPDLVVANFLNATIGIYIAFQPGFYSSEPVELRVGTQPIAVVAGDLNGDGMIDLVTANYGSSNVSLLPADPTGFFRPAVPYPLASHPTDLVGRDLNGDGRLDLVVGFESQGMVASLRSDTGFSFSNQTAYATGGQRVTALEFADLNGDRLPDLIALDDATDGFRVLRGLGNGGFALWQRIPGPSAPTGVVGEDFDLDGVMDLAVTGGANAELAVYQGRGDGRFGVENRVPAPVAPLLLSGDLDGDGRDDLVTLGTSAASPGVEVRLNPSGSALVLAAPVPAVGAVEAAALADLDGDGRLDLVLSDSGRRALRTFGGNGAGGFLPGAQFPIPEVASALLAADVTGDGRVDLLVAFEASRRVDLWIGDPAAPGGFRAGASLTTDRSPVALAAADFDGDGRRDLAVGLRDAHRVVVFAGSDDGPRGAARVIDESVTPVALRTTDLDADGRPDLVFISEAPPELRLLRAGPDFQFEVTALGALAAGPVSLDFGDLNADGRPDFVVGCATSGVVSTWLSSGGVGLRGRADYGTGAGPEGGGARALSAPGAPRPMLVAVAARPERGLLTLVPGAQVTPVELLEFSAARDREGVRLRGRIGGTWRGGRVQVLRIVEGEPDVEICRPVVIAEAPFACLDTAAPSGFVHYRLELQSADGDRTSFGPIEVGPATPPALTLNAGPNPFRNRLAIDWSVSEPGVVRIDVVDASGRRVAALDPGARTERAGRLEWDGRGVSGRPLPAGVYWIRLEASGRVATRRLLRLD